MSATSQQFFGLDKDSDGDSPIRIHNLWACECDLLAQEVILAHSATPECCFGSLVSMEPNDVRQYISDMSACQQHADPERVRSLLRQNDDMLVAAWCVTHGNECRTVDSDTRSWQHLHGPQLTRQALWNGWATHEDLLHLGSSDTASTAQGHHRGEI